MVLKIATFKVKITQRRFIFATGTLFFALLAFYIFNLGFTVVNAAKITKLEREIGSLSHKVGNMEAELIVYQNQIDLNLAYSLGFKETSKIKFIPERSVATILGSNQVQ